MIFHSSSGFSLCRFVSRASAIVGNVSGHFRQKMERRQKEKSKFFFFFFFFFLRKGQNRGESSFQPCRCFPLDFAAAVPRRFISVVTFGDFLFSLFLSIVLFFLLFPRLNRLFLLFARCFFLAFLVDLSLKGERALLFPGDVQ